MAGFDLDRIGGRRALSELTSEVLAAGEEALRFYPGGVARYIEKPDRSPVTEADKAVEARLRAFCERRFPDVGFFGEESGQSDSGPEDIRFIVDPIDGTRAFIRGLPTWSVLVGLEADGLPCVGIAFMPATGDLFVGVRGEGAMSNGRPLRVSGVSSADQALVCHGAIDQFVTAGLVDALPGLVHGTYSLRGLHDFDGYRQLLWGRADAMIDPAVAPWDVCAVAVLVREAGGTFTDLRGEETLYGQGALASNGAFHAELVQMVAAGSADGPAPTS